MDISTDDAKSAAKSLRSRLAAEGVHISHSLALEATAAQLGLRDWNTASAVLDGPRLGPAVPVLRIQDDQLAREGLPPVWLTRGVWVNQAADAVA